MSGKRIDDHKFWAGGASEGSVFPKGVHLKEESSAEGAGHLGTTYPDTTDQIREGQVMADKKALAHKTKPNYRY